MKKYMIVFLNDAKFDADGVAEITEQGCLQIIDSDGIVIAVNADQWKMITRIN